MTSASLPAGGMPIASLMRRDVVRIGLETTVRELRGLFADRGLSWAPVVDAEGTVIGVVSATDLAGPRVADHDIDTLQAWQFCTYRPLAVAPDTPTREVAREMLAQGLHHVVVADDHGLVGVVSSLDFVRLVATA